MKKLKETLGMWQAKAYCRYLNFKYGERGDTNFISILIILGIVVVLGGLFIGFKDQIIGKVTDMVQGFLARFGG